MITWSNKMKKSIIFTLICFLCSTSFAQNKLPYWGSWNTGENQQSDGQDTGYTPDWQLQQISQGKHIHPTFELFTDNLPRNIRTTRAVYFEPAWTYAKTNKLPITFVGRNFEQMFKELEPWKSMTKEDPHPFIQKTDGLLLKYATSPWNKNTHHWYDLGLKLGQYLSREFAQDYPDCPYVYLGNNNEVGLALLNQAKLDIAIPSYLVGADSQLIHREMWDGYRLRRGEFLKGLDDGCPEWAGRMHTFAYTGFGNEFCSVESSVPGIYRYPWIGGEGKLEFAGLNVTANIGYLHSWSSNQAWTVRSPQVECCNARHALDVYRRSVNPEFELETHFWNGKAVPPDAWKGVVRTVLWVMRSEKNRLFLGSSQTVASTYDRDMKPLVEAIEEVHTNSVLRDFWENGTLLENRWTRDWVAQPKLGQYDTATGYGHPYYWKTSVPPEEQDPGNRWYLQHVPLNNRLIQWVENGLPRPMMRDYWQSDREHKTVIPVFAIAIQKGDEYLIYAHAPQGQLNDVEIQVCPDGGIPRFSITVDVPVEGEFYIYRPEILEPVLLTPVGINIPL